jgi:hypothetical protein
MNLYGYLGSNPVNSSDPAGLWFTLPELLLVTGEESYLRSQEGLYVTGLTAMIFALLGDAATSGQWGVMGGMSASGFELFIEGIDATMRGAYALGESLMTAAEATTTLAVFAMSQADAVKRARSLWNPLSKHWAYLATGGPNLDPSNHWAREIRAWIDRIDRLVGRMRGKTAQRWSDWVSRAREGLEALLRGSGSNSPPPMPG